MKNYGQYCPIARASELFAERWTPIIVRNLLMGCRTFGEIADGLPGISPSLLSTRLRQLESHGIVMRSEGEGRSVVYELTEAGRDLERVTDALGEWGATWLEETTEHLDPYVVVWAKSQLMDSGHLSGRRLVVRFEIVDSAEILWLVADSSEAEVCVRDPGYEVDLVLQTTRRSLADWHMGRVSLAQAVDAGDMTIRGAPAARRALIRLGGLSKFAHVQRVSV